MVAGKKTGYRPHGIRYSLTLHAANGQRLLGYDNAHAIREKKGKYAAIRYVAFDHRHRHIGDKGVAYHFTSARQLLVDFWEDVDRALKKYAQI